jgi:hypothetical protein
MADAGAKTQTGRRAEDDQMDSAIEACSACHRICLVTARKCLQKGGKHADVKLVTVLLDCAEICSTSVDFMERGSARYGVICGACAEICRACSRACRDVGGEEMERCAEVCDTCAASCDLMTKRAGTSEHHQGV